VVDRSIAPPEMAAEVQDFYERIVGAGIGQVLSDHSQRLINAVTARREHGPGDPFLRFAISSVMASALTSNGDCVSGRGR